MFICLHTNYKVLSSVTTLYAYDFCLYTVISEPDDVTVCEGTSTSLSCVLNGSISSDNVQWYRLIKDTSTVQRVSDAGDDFVDIPMPNQNNFTTTLYIFTARRSFTGYYWVRSSLGDACNTSFTVSTGIFALHICMCNCV